VLDAAPVALATVTSDGLIVAANARLLGLAGRRACLAGTSLFDLFHPDDAPGAAAAFRRFLRSDRQDWELLHRLPGSDDGQRLIRLRASRTADGAVVVLEDATADRQALAAMARREERFRHLIENASDLITLLAAGGTILYLSPSAQRILGWRPEELTGVNVFDHVHPDDVPHTLDGFAEMRASGDLSTTMFRYRHKDGHWVHIESSGRSLLDDPAVRGIVVNSRDISERVQAEETQRALEQRLREKQKLEAIGELAGGIAHDFNNLLTAIFGYGGHAAQYADGVVAKDIAQIQHAAERAASLTRQLLAFARRQVMQPHVIDLSGLVDELSDMLSRLLGEQIEVVTDLEPDARVYADPSQLTQVIVNLAVNARDAMRDGGRLTIRTRRQSDPIGTGPGTVTLEVGDTGSGIDVETQERIFEPFFTTKPLGEGTGLGLATVYGIVEQSGGTVTVDSAVGIGSRFTVSFPATDEPVESDKGGPSGAVRAGRGSVLLVEDDEMVRIVVGGMLASSHDVIAAASPEQALAHAAAGKCFDLVVSDLVMPGMNGRKLVDELRKHQPGLRTILTSGYPADVLEGPAGDDYRFLQKPFTQDQLLHAIHEALVPSAD
jgi:PAS domain S-box-containing protein